MTEYLSSQYDLQDATLVSVYDETPLWSALVGTLLLEHVPLTANVRLKDVASGTGFPLLELAQRLGPTCRATGIDIWKPACERARQKVKTLGIANVTIVEADAAAVPFGDGEFNLIVSNLGINNFEN